MESCNDSRSLGGGGGGGGRGGRKLLASWKPTDKVRLLPLSSRALKGILKPMVVPSKIKSKYIIILPFVLLPLLLLFVLLHL